MTLKMYNIQFRALSTNSIFIDMKKCNFIVRQTKM